MNTKLTVREILERPYFHNSKVYASERALERTIKWTHVLEVDDVGDLLNGNELILTTGLTWNGSEQKCLKFLQQIMDSHAAGLVIDMGRVVDEIPERMIRLAQSEDFPLILIYSDIRYIDVTHDIHAFVINRQKKMMEDLEHFSVQLNELLLMGEGIKALLTLFFTFTGHAIAYVPVKGRTLCIPHSGYFQKWSESLLVTNSSSNRSSVFPVMVMNQLFGYLMVHAYDDEDHFIVLALDRCATAVAQEIMRSMYWEERQLNRENQWISRWLDGQLDENTIKEKLWRIKPNMTFTWCGVAAFEQVNNKADAGTVQIHKNIVLRTVLGNESFFVLPIYRDHQLICILLDLIGSRDEKEIEKAVIRAMEQLAHYISNEMFFLWGVSGSVQPLDELGSCVSEAVEVIDIQRHIGRMATPFFRLLHIYHIIHEMDKNGSLEPFIRQQIGGLLDSGDGKRSELLFTLKIYLECAGSKKEAAQKLYISRQSLYKRLEKINERLGGHFEDSPKRLAIEMALAGHAYLLNDRVTED